MADILNMKYTPLKKGARDLTNCKINDWTVLGYMGKGMWECECSCGTIKLVAGKSLIRGDSKSCGHSSKALNDITDKYFGEWHVIKRTTLRNNRWYWMCECSCGKVKEMDAYSLTSGKSKSCGHNKLEDLKGRQFESLTVREYLGKGVWLCDCSCGGVVEATGKELREDMLNIAKIIYIGLIT